MVADPSAANDNGNKRPAAAAASCTCCRMQPASTVMVLLSGSMARIRFMRARLTTTSPLGWLAGAHGVAPPTRPVLPPCGTMATSAAAQTATTRATSPVQPGRTTHKACPMYLPRQSVRNGAMSEASRSTWVAPTMSASELINPFVIQVSSA